jgi:hypothetical protein
MNAPGSIANEKLPISIDALSFSLCSLFPIHCPTRPLRAPRPRPPFAPGAASVQIPPAAPHMPQELPWPLILPTQQSTSQSSPVRSSVPPCSNRLEISNACALNRIRRVLRVFTGCASKILAEVMLIVSTTSVDHWDTSQRRGFRSPANNSLWNSRCRSLLIRLSQSTPLSIPSCGWVPSAAAFPQAITERPRHAFPERRLVSWKQVFLRRSLRRPILPLS